MRKRFEATPCVPARALWIAISMTGSFCAASCVQTLDPGSAPPAPTQRAPAPRETTSDAAVSTGANAASVAILTWNLDWFQDPTEGPRDDAGQYAAVRDILADANADLIALEEIAVEPAFDRLRGDLREYAGVLSGYDWTQKTALLWRASMFELVSARALSGLDDAGRPPLEVQLRDRARAEPLLVVVIHAKAQADVSSRDTRERLAQGVKAQLDAEYAAMPIVVLGDFNDRLRGSITQDAQSPYRAFVDDAHYAAPTLRLDAASARESSYTWGPTIDHILLSDELEPRVDPASIDVRREELQARYPDYGTTVSDHFPVTLTLRRCEATASGAACAGG